MEIGFTGTQKGMTPKQKSFVFEFLGAQADDYRVNWLHHGDCIGADADACEIARSWGYLLCCHPPKNQSKRAFVESHNVQASFDYLVRNRHIVRHCTVLLATPRGSTEELRSGTWATVRYAIKNKTPVCIAWPDGSHRWVD